MISKYLYKSTTVYVLLSEWNSPNPCPPSECALPPPPPGPEGGGGAHSPAAEGVGELQFRRLKKKLRS
jgi:hypothetical protein